MDRVAVSVDKDEAVRNIARQASLGEVNPYTANVPEALANALARLQDHANASFTLRPSSAIAGLEARSTIAATSHKSIAPDHRNGRPECFPSPTETEVSPAFELLEIPGGYLVQIGCAPVVALPTLDCIVDDFSSRYARLAYCYDFELRRVLADARRINGAALVLCDDIRPVNYSHWLLDTLPRLALLAEVSRLDDLHVVASAPLRSFQWETLRRCGFGDDRVVLMEDFTAVQARQLLVSRDLSWMPHPAFKGADWALRFLRDKLAAPDSEPDAGAKLYVSRGDSNGRYLINEEELVQRLEPLGYQRVTLGLRSVANQAALFARATHIVALHGAGLANFVFCRAGTQVVELFPSTYGTPAYYVIAAAVGCRYASYVADETVAWMRNQIDDVRIDVDRFIAVMGDVL